MRAVSCELGDEAIPALCVACNKRFNISNIACSLTSGFWEIEFVSTRMRYRRKCHIIDSLIHTYIGRSMPTYKERYSPTFLLKPHLQILYKRPSEPNV